MCEKNNKIKNKFKAPSQGNFSSAAVISKPAAVHDDEDIFSTLLKYEKEVRAEKKEKKHFERKKKELGKVPFLNFFYK